MFTGSCVALITPFKNNEVDKEKLRELVEFHLSNGTDAILPCGTTGESATLSYEEHIEVIRIVVETVKKRIPVIAGTGSNSTRETYELTKHAKEIGADAVLLVAPYYNKPTQKGLYEHYSFIAKNVDIPIIIYNIPGRTGVNISPETIISLAKAHKNIIGVKEASGSIDQVSEIVRNTAELNFSVFSGDDSLTLPILAVGGKGVISVIANILPRDTHNLCEYWFRGDVKKAQELHLKMFPLVKALFIETNPIPIKAAMGMLGLCSDELRLPLVPMEEKNREKLYQALKNYGLVK
jgi:4-hydroxy-tetrahydrodipicolinate synthase